jgi:hypothetical protein
VAATWVRAAEAAAEADPGETVVEVPETAALIEAAAFPMTPVDTTPVKELLVAPGRVTVPTPPTLVTADSAVSTEALGAVTDPGADTALNGAVSCGATDPRAPAPPA